MPELETHVVLRDGTRALVRPIHPDDKDRLRRGMELLSPRSRYLRFHAAIDHLTEDHLRYLTEVDRIDHAAWVALDEDRPDHPGMGVARYVRLHDEPTVAEAAVTVVDEYQGRGLGTVLLGFLARTATKHGIDAFRNYVLPDNEPMLELLRELGADGAVEVDGALEVDVPVVADADELPDTPAARVLRSVATGGLRVLVSAWFPIRVPDSGGG
ncbi:MAG: GNAT family N-acetyltransferase [Actinobacteria bacterium]|nr:GNAT family N-acetyltransferase [Actinomycetota bacterium]